MQHDKFQQCALLELNRMLDEEMKKPLPKRDYQKIAEISRACSAVLGDEAKEKEVIRQGKQAFSSVSEMQSTRILRKRIHPATAVAVAVMAVLLSANFVTVRATNQNIVSFVIEYAQNGFSVIPIQEEQEIHLPTTPDDPYGIKGFCARYGLDVEAPYYLPDGFYLWDVEEHENSAFKTISFWFRSEKVHLQFSYTEFYDSNGGSKIPSDYFNLEEIEVNGHSAITSKEDGQYNLICYDGNLEYLIFSDNLDYAECEKIVASIH